VSYDITIGSEDFNYTFNVSKLFYDHIPAERNRGGLCELDGLTGRQASEVLAAAFGRIGESISRDWIHADIGEPKFCARYDADNGWGSAVGALVFLACLMAACNRNPRKKVWVGV
jgi:hypothetical protein